MIETPTDLGHPEQQKKAHEDREAILAALAEGQTMEAAAAAGGIGRTTLWGRCREDGAFAAHVAQARDEGRKLRADTIAAALFAGAEKVRDDPRFTTCAIFALKNLDPEHWRDAYDQRFSGGLDVRTPRGMSAEDHDELCEQILGRIAAGRSGGDGAVTEAAADVALTEPAAGR